MIKFDHVTKRYPDGTVAVDDLELEAPSGQITVLVGPSGCGKTTSLRMINRMIEPDRRGTIWLDDQRHRESTPATSCAAGSATSSSTPGCSRTAPSSTTSPPCPSCSGSDKKQAAQARDGAARARRPRPGVRQALPGPALRWPAAARRRRPRAGRRPAGDADGRAVQRRRPGRARAAAGRVPAAAGRARQDDRLRHPRHRRGDQARRPGRGAARRRQARPARHPGRAALATRPTPSSPASSAATAATARSASPSRCAAAARRAHRDARATAAAAAGPATPGCSSSTTSAARRAGCAARRLDAAVAGESPGPADRGGTLATQGGTLRAALDAACPRRRGRGVVVDERRAGCSARSPRARCST